MDLTFCYIENLKLWKPLWLENDISMHKLIVNKILMILSFMFYLCFAIKTL